MLPQAPDRSHEAPSLHPSQTRGLAQTSHGDDMSAAAPPLLAASLSLGLLATAQIDQAPWLIWNASESVPVGLYVGRASHPPSLGDLVAVRLPEDLTSWAVERGYIGVDTLLMKRVAAVAGMSHRQTSTQ